MATRYGSHIVLERKVNCKKLSIVPWRRGEIYGSHIVFECNVKCMKLSIVPWSRGDTLENLEKELKKNKWLAKYRREEVLP